MVFHRLGVTIAGRAEANVLPAGVFAGRAMLVMGILSRAETRCAVKHDGMDTRDFP
jgi:hypothetical protein